MPIYLIGDRCNTCLIIDIIRTIEHPNYFSQVFMYVCKCTLFTVPLIYEIKSIILCVYEQDSCGGGVTTFTFQRRLFVQTGDDCALCCLHCFQGRNMRIFHWRKSESLTKVVIRRK
jgi:hypothetical protein